MTAAIHSNNTLLFSRHARGRPIEITADSAGKVHAFVAGAEVPFLGIPSEIDRSNEKMVAAAKRLLSEADIQDCRIYLLVAVKLAGGAPPRETGEVRPMSEEEGFLFDSLKDQMISGLAGPLTTAAWIRYAPIIAGVPVLATATVLGLITATLGGSYIRYNNKLSTNSKIKTLGAQVTKLNADVMAHTITIDQYLKSLDALSKSSLQNAADVGVMVQDMFEKLNEFKDSFSGATPPSQAEATVLLSTLTDLVDMASRAIPDKKLARQVNVIGHATVNFGRAFHALRGIGSLATASLSSLANPIALALTGIAGIYSLASDEGIDMAALSGQIQDLSTQLSDMETSMGLHFDQIQKVLCDYRIETLENFKQLNGNINLLRQQSENYHIAVKTKLDRVANHLSRGLMAIQLSDLNKIIYRSNAYKEDGTLTNERREKALIDLAFWALRQSRNAIFSGLVNVNNQKSSTYDPQDIYDVLSSHSEMELIGYLANYPKVSAQVRDGAGALVNPVIWGNAVIHFMALLEDVATLNANQCRRFEEIYNAGQTLNQFIAKLQKDAPLFTALITDYRAIINDLLALPFDQLQEVLRPESNDRRAVALDAQLLLLRAYCKLAFNRSCHYDLIFSSLIFGTGTFAPCLMSSKNLRDSIAVLTGNPDQVRLAAIGLVKLKETCNYFHEIVQQKVAGANDTHSVINSLCQAVWKFGNDKTGGAVPFAPGSYPSTGSLHFTDLAVVTPSLSFAVHTGDAKLIRRLATIAAVQVRDPLEMQPLHHACLTGEIEWVNHFISLGANVSARDNQNYTPSHYVSGASGQNIIDTLVLEGASAYPIHDANLQPAIKPLFSPLLQRLVATLGAPAGYNYSTDLSPSWGWSNGALFTRGNLLTLSATNYVACDPSNATALPLNGERVRGVFNDTIVYQQGMNFRIGDLSTGTSITFPITGFGMSGSQIALTEDYFVTNIAPDIFKIWRLNDKHSIDIPYKPVLRFLPLKGNKVFAQWNDQTVTCIDATTGDWITYGGEVNTHRYQHWASLSGQNRVVAIEDPITVPAGLPSPTPLHLIEINSGEVLISMHVHSLPVVHLLAAQHIFVSIDTGGNTYVWDAAGNIIRHRHLALRSFPGVAAPRNIVRLLGEEALLFLNSSGQLHSWDLLSGVITTLKATSIPYSAFDIHQSALSTITDNTPPPKRLEIYQFKTVLDCETYAPFKWS